MFASSRDIGTDGTEDLGALMCTEGAGDLLLTLIIRTSRSTRLLSKGMRKSYMKARTPAFRFCKRLSRFYGRCIFGTADGSGSCFGCGWVGGKACGNERIVLGFVEGQAFWRQSGEPFRGRFDFGFDGAQQVSHLFSPSLAVLFDNKAEFAQMMDVAESVLTVGKLEVGSPVVMQSNALVVGQDASDSHAEMAAFGMDVVMGQFFCAGHVQPMQPLYDPQTTLIEMDDRGGDELLADAFQGWVDSLGELTGGCEHDRLRGCMPVERSQQLGDARQGDELLAVEVAGKCLQTPGHTGSVGSRGRENAPFTHAPQPGHCLTSA